MNITAFLKTKKRPMAILAAVLLALVTLTAAISCASSPFADGWHKSEFREKGEAIPQEAIGEALGIDDGD